MKIKFAKIVGIAEIVSAFAIIVSLIFVGIQLRENTIATRSATANAIHSDVSTWYMELGNNNQSSTLFLNYLGNPDSLSSEERFQITMLAHSMLLKIQNSYYLEKEGTLDQHIRWSVTNAIIAVKDQPGFNLFWQQRKAMFFPEFRASIDSLMQTDINVSEELYKKQSK